MNHPKHATLKLQSVAGCATAVALMAFPVLATGASPEYPTKPVRIVATAAGGSNDLVARLVAQGMTQVLGQQVIIENRGGAVTAAELVARAQPDGYTLLAYGSALWLSPFMRDHTPYDPIRDFAPISQVTRVPNVLVIHPAVAANSVKELIALAKSKPGTLNYASGASGASNHLAGELFNAMAGVNITRVPYKGIAPAITDLLAGYVQMSFAPSGSAIPHIKTGKLRPLAVTTAQPSAMFPGLPTVAASGLPGYESVAVSAIFAPARTSPALVNRLQHDIVRGLNLPGMQDKFLGLGAETVGSTPAQLAAAVKAEMSRMGKLIKDRAIREE